MVELLLGCAIYFFEFQFPHLLEGAWVSDIY